MLAALSTGIVADSLFDCRVFVHLLVPHHVVIPPVCASSPPKMGQSTAGRSRDKPMGPCPVHQAYATKTASTMSRALGTPSNLFLFASRCGKELGARVMAAHDLISVIAFPSTNHSHALPPAS